MIFKKKHEDVAAFHSKYDGGVPMQPNHEAVAKLHGQDGGMPMQHNFEAVSKLCGGGMAKGKK
jgi:hypothetical protein